jgi:TonB family protein
MRDRLLAYALAVSVGIHIIALIVVGRNAAVKTVSADDLHVVQVNMAKLGNEPRPAIRTPKVEPTKPKPAVKQTVIPAKPQHSAERPVVVPKRTNFFAPLPVRPSSSRPRVISPVYSSKPARTASNRLPGNPGGALNMGSTSARGMNLGASGRTHVGWVASGCGLGEGSGHGAGRGTPEPDAKAVDGPGRVAAPAPPPPADVDVKVCAESGMLPGEYCERTVIRSYRPGHEPTSICNVCRPRHVSTLADRSKPELISGPKQPKYPRSARDAGIQGAVVVEYTINTEGDVSGAKVTSSSGNSDLDRAAVDTVESRKYKPAVQAGIPRNYRKRETFHFALD